MQMSTELLFHNPPQILFFGSAVEKQGSLGRHPHRNSADPLYSKSSVFLHALKKVAREPAQPLCGCRSLATETHVIAKRFCGNTNFKLCQRVRWVRKKRNVTIEGARTLWEKPAKRPFPYPLKNLAKLRIQLALQWARALGRGFVGGGSWL